MEHIKSPRLIEKLDEFLGFPTSDPHGDPIPDGKGKIKSKPQIPLDQLEEGYRGIIVAVKDSDSDLLKYLEKIGAKPGKKIQLISKEAYDNSMEILLDNQKTFISKEVSKNILVTE